MRKYNSTFEEEEENYKNFSEKLSKFQSVSKDLKKKNKFTQHQLEWTKEYKNLQKKQFQLQNELIIIIQNIDSQFSSDIHELLNDEGSTCYYDYYSNLCKQNQQMEVNLWYQLKLLRSYVNPNSQIKKSKQKIYQKNPQLNQISRPSSVLQKRDETLAIIEQICKMFEEFQNNSPIIDEFKDAESVFSANSQISQYWITQLSKDQVKGWDRTDLLDNQSFFQIILQYEDNSQEEQYLISQYNQAMQFLNERYQLELQRIYQLYTPQKIQLFLDDPLFFKIFRHIYKTYIKKGKEREFYMERLFIQFPNETRKFLMDCDNYFMQEEQLQKRKNALIRNWYREKINLKEIADQQILEQLKIRIESSKNEIQKKQLNIQINEIHTRLQEQMVQFESKNLQLKKEEENEKERLYQIEQYQKEIQLKHQQKLRDETEKYQAHKQVETEIKNENLRQLKIQEQNDKIKSIIQNRPKVINRQNIEINKLFDKLDKKEEKQKFKEYEEARIEHAIENFSFRPQIPSDPKRILKNTKSLNAKKLDKMDKADKVIMFRNNGYTVDRLMGDLRYKLGNALNEAGLGGSSYAQGILNNLVQREK